jgi:deoxyribonuclease V
LRVRLSGQAEVRDRVGPIALVAGIDVGFEQHGRVTRAAVAVLDLADLRLVESSLARRLTGFPYVPGLLSFREIPAVLDALAALRRAPDLLVCDGQGLAHPRRFGLACHLGWLLDTPSIGVATSRLLGDFLPLPAARGAWAPLVDRQEIVGAVLRSRQGVRPVFVSPGHRADGGVRGPPHARLYRLLPPAGAEPRRPSARIGSLSERRRPAPRAKR